MYRYMDHVHISTACVSLVCVFLHHTSPKPSQISQREMSFSRNLWDVSAFCKLWFSGDLPFSYRLTSSVKTCPVSFPLVWSFSFVRDGNRVPERRCASLSCCLWSDYTSIRSDSIKRNEMIRSHVQTLEKTRFHSE